ncbi:MAG: hypothetical protein EXR99_13210 [Gemmataceae bacterium]|nr:hypothetical protein [Gemmataceae bacterium]
MPAHPGGKRLNNGAKAATVAAEAEKAELVEQIGRLKVEWLKKSQSNRLNGSGSGPAAWAAVAQQFQFSVGK